MKLSEAKNERTFNLEISESDLQLLMTAVCHVPRDHEGFTEDVHDAMAIFRGACFDVNVSPIARSESVLEY